MEQVVGNLIENAKKYVRPGGEIRLTIACAERHLDFSIFNHGDVIPERELPRIWEKFYRGENSASGGSGLGLAMAAQILSLYHAPLRRPKSHGRSGILLSFFNNFIRS